MRFSIFSLLFLAIFGLTSCDKKDFDNNHDERKCFEYVYPLSYLMPDDTTISGDNEEHLNEQLKAWYNANPNADKRHELIFPIDVRLDDGTILSVEHKEDFEAIYKDCKEDEHDHDHDNDHDDDNDNDDHHNDDCFKYVYPLTYTLPDGTSANANNEEETEMIFQNWHNANPDSQERPTLDFPFDVSFENHDAIITVHNEEELRGIYERCN